MAEKLKLTVAGFTYTVTADDGEALYYRDLADRLDERIAELVRDTHLSTASAAVYAALEAADRAARTGAERDRLRREQGSTADAAAKAREAVGHLRQLEEDFTTAVEEAALARLEADEANRQLVRLKRELAALRGQQEIHG